MTVNTHDYIFEPKIPEVEHVEDFLFSCAAQTHPL